MAFLTDAINAYEYHDLVDREIEAREVAKGYYRQSYGASPFIFKLEHELTLPAFGRDTSYRHDCPNALVRPKMWLRAQTFELLEALNLEFLDQLGQICVKAEIRECRSELCSEKARLMRRVAPTCDWKSFRNWAIVAMSCQAVLRQQEEFTRAHTHLAQAVNSCCYCLKSCLKTKQQLSTSLLGSRQTVVDLAGVCNVIHWMAAIQSSIGIGPKEMGRWDFEFLPQSITLPPIEKAIQNIQGLGICKNRLWNLVSISERRQSDLPELVDALEPHKLSLRHSGHELCTPSLCQFAQLNSTQVKQLHKCQDSKSCKQKNFPSKLLVKSLKSGEGTSWSVHDYSINTRKDPYIAISHVWSDGTGGGLEMPGCVNSCLFDYFASIARSPPLKCNAIWWDTLSIPTDPEARSMALNNMHANYSNAEYTVVHDNYILNFVWRDSESACLALVLSPWFTRGWTALELAMSKKVKVLYKNPNSNTPLLKDLDDDILADDICTTSSVHWFASSLIRRLREPILSLDDLLAILKPRSTSWMRDRTIIAGLLAELTDCDYTRGESEITRDIIESMGDIPYSCLLHGSATMSDFGPYSWCPATLDSMQVDPSMDMRGGFWGQSSGKLRLDGDGAVEGTWAYRLITRDDIIQKRLTPHRDDPSADLKIYIALQRWKSCLLLRENSNGRGPALLVETVGVRGCESFRSNIVECRYAGAVRETLVADTQDNSSQTSPWGQLLVRIGKDDGHPPVQAARILWFLHSTQDETFDENSNFNEFLKLPPTENFEEESVADTRDTSSNRRGPPWYSMPGVVEYRRVNIPKETMQVGKVEIPESAEIYAHHFYLAARDSEVGAMRHLLKVGAHLTVEAKHNLISRPNPRERQTFIRINRLVSFYVQFNRFDDARETCKLAMENYKTLGPEHPYRVQIKKLNQDTLSKIQEHLGSKPVK